MSDWEDFRAEVTWGVAKRIVKASPARPFQEQAFASGWDAGDTFPQLMKLLTKARVTLLEGTGEGHVLFGWHRKDHATCGWLAPLPSRPKRADLYPAHLALLGAFGGVLDRWGDPWPSLLTGTASALTANESGVESDMWYPHYEELCAEEGIAPAVTTPDEYAVVVVEGNSNRVLCHRTSGELIYFAPDPSPHLKTEVMDGAPEYSLYRLVEVPHFASWVETLAQQWLNVIA